MIVHTCIIIMCVCCDVHLQSERAVVFKEKFIEYLESLMKMQEQVWIM